MSFANTNTMNALNKMGGNNRSSLKDSYVDLKVNKDNDEKEVRIRLIGLPFAFTQYVNKKYNAETKKREDYDFPDKEEKPKWTRNWISPGTVDDRYPNDPWDEAGYIGSLRYAQNVLLRNDDDESFSVKILEKGKMMFQLFTDAENMNARRNEKSGKNFVTCLGGEVSHDILVVANFNPKKPQVPDLKIAIEPERSKITDAEIEALKSIGCPTDEELEELFARHPELEAYPRWFWYGYQLPRIYKPDLFPGSEIKSGKASTSRGELDMSDSEPDDDEVESAPAARSTKSASKPAAKSSKPAAKSDDDDESAFDSEEPSDDDW